MIAKQLSAGFGRYVFGLGVTAMAVVCLVWGSFDPGQPVPKDFPYRAVFAYAAAVFMLISGTALAWRRSVVWGAAALSAYFLLVVVLLMNARLVLAHYTEFGSYSGAAEQLAIAAGAWIVFASNARLSAVTSARFVRTGQVVFGVCAILFGGAHFAYLNLTAPLVPAWLPPGQTFWAYATGVAQIAAGLAIVTGVRARLAAVLLTVMYASFTVLVHVPTLLADSSKFFNWTENALNLALIGVAWVVADSLSWSTKRRP